jgi:hypothetical protein
MVQVRAHGPIASDLPALGAGPIGAHMRAAGGEPCRAAGAGSGNMLVSRLGPVLEHVKSRPSSACLVARATIAGRCESRLAREAGGRTVRPRSVSTDVPVSKIALVRHETSRLSVSSCRTRRGRSATRHNIFRKKTCSITEMDMLVSGSRGGVGIK